MEDAVQGRMPGRKTFLAAGLAVAAILGSACWGTSGGPLEGASPSPAATSGGRRPASPPQDGLQVTLRAGDTGPTGVLTHGTERQSGVSGSVCWQEGPGTTGCGDVGADVLVPKSSIAIQRGTVLYVLGDQTTATAQLLTVTNESGDTHVRVAQRLPLVEGASAIDVPPGEYTLEVDGTWPQGDGPLYFGLAVS